MLSLFLKGPFETFYVFGEEIFAANLIEISEMVDFSFWVESDFIEGFGNELFFAPVDIPVIVLSLFPLTIEEGLLDAVGEEGFELDVGALIVFKITNGGGSVLF